jgi:DNA-binding Lrp family transcriptional regulator
MPDWTTLSVRGQAILRTVATSASQGYSTVEIARGFKTSKRWVSDRLDELREEIERTTEVSRREILTAPGS